MNFWKQCFYVFGGLVTRPSHSNTHVPMLSNDMHRHCPAHMHDNDIDVHEKFNITTWDPVVYVAGDSPAPRQGHSAVLHSNLLYIFGGKGAGALHYNDLWTFSLATHKWTQILCPEMSKPRPRAWHSACVSGDHMYMFGGGMCMMNACSHYNDMWMFSFIHRNWTRVYTDISPSARYKHTLVCGGNNAEKKSGVYLFGGHSHSPFITYNDLWMYTSDVHSDRYSDGVGGWWVRGVCVVGVVGIVRVLYRRRRRQALVFSLFLGC